MKVLDNPKAQWAELLRIPLRTAYSKNGLWSLAQDASELTASPLVKECTFEEVQHVKFHPLDYLALILSYQGERVGITHELEDVYFSEWFCQQLNQRAKGKTMEEIGQMDL